MSEVGREWGDVSVRTYSQSRRVSVRVYVEECKCKYEQERECECKNMRGGT